MSLQHRMPALAGPSFMGLVFIVIAAGYVETACGSNNGASDDGGTPEATSPDPDAPAATDDDPNHDPLNGVDAGCPVKIDGPRAGSVAASVPRGISGIAWADPANGLTVDGMFARATVDDGEATDLLRVTGYGFEVPETATVLGVEVTFQRQSSDLGIVDGAIELWLDGRPSRRPKYLATAWPRLIVGTHHYGQAVDTWGDDLTPELVGRSSFGVEIFAKRQDDAGTGPLEARIEAMRVSVFYCD